MFVHPTFYMPHIGQRQSLSLALKINIYKKSNRFELLWEAWLVLSGAGHGIWTRKDFSEGVWVLRVCRFRQSCIVGILRKAPAIYVLHTRGRMLFLYHRMFSTPRHPFWRRTMVKIKATKNFLEDDGHGTLKLSDRKVFSRYLCSGFSEWGKWLPRHGLYRSRTCASGLDARCIPYAICPYKEWGFFGILRIYTPCPYRC